MSILYILMGILPWLVIFGGAVYLNQLLRRPGPEQLHRAEVDELREEVSLMRDFIRDAMHRLARLEEERESRGALAPGEPERLSPPPSPGPTVDPGDS
jgi:hypothetical protein